MREGKKRIACDEEEWREKGLRGKRKELRGYKWDGNGNRKL